ncbi:acyltransferase family protein [Geodermatophilus normandii]|uniref:Acyltransferase n=1 Tax=Geodermatophilus normandii TaxID=1137989 RepID=A0A6P0GF99_9ACTN|nr:acyltransferase [Geodermatophilus normandii]
MPVRLPTLTGLRAVAALMVFFVHVRGLQPARVQPEWSAVFGVGGAGVSFFFVLSGFVLAWTWGPVPPRIRDFYRRRAARVLPNHLVTWILGALLTLLAIVALGGGRPRASILAFLLGIPLLQAWVPVDLPGINGPAWTLSCEAFFYALLPFLVVPLRRTTERARWLVAGAMVAALVAVPLLVQVLGPQDESLRVWVVDVLPVARLPEFVLGCVLGLQVAAGTRVRCPLPASLVLAAAALVLVDLTGQSSYKQAITAVPFALVIVAGAQRDLRGGRSWLARPWPVRLGEWSFAFYLVHELVIRSLMLAVGPVPTPAAGLALAALALALSTVVAWQLHVRVEVPAERRWRGTRAPRAELASPLLDPDGERSDNSSGPR